MDTTTSCPRSRSRSSPRSRGTCGLFRSQQQQHHWKVLAGMWLRSEQQRRRREKLLRDKAQVRTCVESTEKEALNARRAFEDARTQAFQQIAATERAVGQLQKLKERTPDIGYEDCWPTSSDDDYAATEQHHRLLKEQRTLVESEEQGERQHLCRLKNANERYLLLCRALKRYQQSQDRLDEELREASAGSWFGGRKNPKSTRTLTSNNHSKRNPWSYSWDDDDEYDPFGRVNYSAGLSTAARRGSYSTAAASALKNQNRTSYEDDAYTGYLASRDEQWSSSYSGFLDSPSWTSFSGKGRATTMCL